MVLHQHLHASLGEKALLFTFSLQGSCLNAPSAEQRREGQRTAFLAASLPWALRKGCICWACQQQPWLPFHFIPGIHMFPVQDKKTEVEEKNIFNYVWWWRLTSLTVVTISQDSRLSNHYTVHLKVIRFMPVKSQFKRRNWSQLESSKVVYKHMNTQPTFTYRFFSKIILKNAVSFVEKFYFSCGRQFSLGNKAPDKGSLLFYLSSKLRHDHSSCLMDLTKRETPNP